MLLLWLIVCRLLKIIGTNKNLSVFGVRFAFSCSNYAVFFWIFFCWVGVGDLVGFYSKLFTVRYHSQCTTSRSNLVICLIVFCFFFFSWKICFSFVCLV